MLIFKKNFSGFKFWLRNENEGVLNWFFFGLGFYSFFVGLNIMVCELLYNIMLFIFWCLFEVDF